MEPAFRTVAPAETPVTLAEVKAHCRVGENDDDAVLSGLLAAATDYIDGPQGLLGKCMVTQTWVQKLEDFADCVRLTVAPVASVSTITYYDADNAEQTLSATVYELRRDTLGAYVALKSDQSWPTIYDRKDAVTITFFAGVAAADVPDTLKTAVLMLVSHWDENRDGGSEIPNSVRHLVGIRREMFV